MAYPISDVTRRVVYSGSAGLGPYSFSFEILAEGDIGVYFNTTLLTLTTDYTVTINEDGTGSIEIVTGSAVPDTPDSADTISIFGTKGIARSTDFVTGGDLFANSLNDELDAQTIFAQQNSEAILRSIRAPVTDPTTINMEIPDVASRKGKALAFDETTGNPIVTAAISDIATVADNIDAIIAVANFILNFSTVSSSSGSVTLDTSTSGNYKLTLTENVTSMTFSNPNDSGEMTTLTLIVVQDSTARTIAWPAAVKWPYGAEPEISTASGAIDIFSFFTHDGGTTWYGFPSGKAFA